MKCLRILPALFAYFCLNRLVSDTAGRLASKQSDNCDMIVSVQNFLESLFEESLVRQNISMFIRNNFMEWPEKRRLFVLELLRTFLSWQPSSKPVAFLIDKELTQRLGPHINVQLVFAQTPEDVYHGAMYTWRTRYLIVLMSSATRREKRRMMSSIFAHFLKQHYTIDVNVLVNAACTLEFYSFLPYTDKECVSSKPLLMAKSVGNRTEWQVPREYLYINKLRNMHGCPLSVVVWPMPPYMELDWHASEPNAHMQGIDAEVLKVVAKKLNFTLALLPNEPSTLLGGVMYTNGTMSGSYKMLYQRRANITIGCATPGRSLFLTASVPYFQVKYIFVLKAAPHYSNYEIMFFPFDRYTWLLVLVSGITRELLSRGVARRYAIAKPTTLRHMLLGAWLCLAFALRSSYESSILEYVHNAPTKPMPSTVEQLIEQNYLFITDHATYRLTESTPSINRRTLIVPGQPVDVFEQLYDHPVKTVALSSTVFLAYHLAKHPQQHARYTILSEPLTDNMICMFYPRDSYMANAINLQLMRLRSFGLIKQLTKRFDYVSLPRSTDKVQSNEPRSFDQGERESMRFVMSALRCLLIAEGFILLIFGLECLSLRCRWLAMVFRHL